MLIADEFDWPAMVKRLPLQGLAKLCAQRATLRDVRSGETDQITFSLEWDLDDAPLVTRPNIHRLTAAIRDDADADVTVITTLAYRPKRRADAG